MRTLIMLFSVCSVLLGAASVGHAETIVIDFDDYEGPLAPISDGYAGFPSWGNFAYTSTESEPPYIPHSGTTYAVAVGGPLPIVFDDNYVFSGAWFASYLGNGIIYELYDGDTLVYTSPLLMLSEEYEFVPSGYDGLVNRVLVLYGAGTNTWAMDDFTYETIITATMNSTCGAVKSLYR